MNGAELNAFLGRVLPAWAAHADELRDLDAALGDGDLGITVSSGANAMLAAVADADPAPGGIVLAAAKAFATANPSTFAALVGGGLLAAGKSLDGATEIGRTEALEALTAFAERVMARGKAQRGDKTLLDALLPAIDALAESPEDAAPRELAVAMREAAWAGVRETADAVSQHGRAAWVGERGAGNPDPGATAVACLLDAVAEKGFGA